jgi:hypothetical protein
MVRYQSKCPFCTKMGLLLNGREGVTRFKGWTRYGCEHGHKFAVPTYAVESGRRLVSFSRDGRSTTWQDA